MIPVQTLPKTYPAHTYALTFAERIFLRRLIRSLEDRHSVISRRLLQLRFEALFKKKEPLLPVFIHENSCQSEGFLRTKAYDNALDRHLSSSSSHFLIIDLEGTLNPHAQESS
jgi:hypothetical protein